jgi:hypothetical protein
VRGPMVTGSKGETGVFIELPLMTGLGRLA